uniref:FAD-dependent monooxygenase DEP2 ) n=1 Tax=Ganoderma boninense TaxID=34458 RepID=A0A5K1K1N1_9APHY|nr:FAD-dependent monooxygenase DEP2 (EC (Depudecin biosynthesis cluster protein 2) [Ganoderma boninense]
MQLKFKPSVFSAALATLSLSQAANAGPIAYGICQTATDLPKLLTITITELGCNTVAVACYAGAGFTFGTVTAGLGAPAAILACNAALGTCSSACAAIALLAPTP